MRTLLVVAVMGCGTEPSINPNPELVPPPDPPPAAWGVPISGGTLLATRDGHRAVIADPDRDRVVLVDLDRDAVIETIALPAGSEPGRLIEDGAGRIHVALRGSGELLTLDAEQHVRAICGEPRGLAWEAKTDLVHVACATGELVSVPAASGDAVRTVRLERDLRDVIVAGNRLYVTKFRSAELLELGAQGRIAARIVPPLTYRLDLPAWGGDELKPAPGQQPPSDPSKLAASAEVAWRTIVLPDGRIVMSHQRKVGTTLRPTPGGYGTGCGHGPVESALTVVDGRNAPFAVAPFVSDALPVDVAVDPTGAALAFAVVGRQSVQVIATSRLTTPDDDNCGSADPAAVEILDDQLGAPTSVVYRPNGDLLVFYPEADALMIDGRDKRAVPLGDAKRTDAGRTLFHHQTFVGLACASCHPEGRDDGQVWSFEQLGNRRTMNLAGGILSRAPYHWSGDMIDLRTLLDDVFTERMAGELLADTDHVALGQWLDRVKAPKGIVVDAQAAQRGQALFTSQALGCTGCHAGPLLTNNALVNVGTAGIFKVPSLAGVGARAPYLHDGCALTLADRFGPCGGGDLHGHTSQLGDAERTDLIAYLQSL